MKSKFLIFLVLGMLYYTQHTYAQMTANVGFSVVNSSLCLSAGETVFNNTTSGPLTSVAKWGWDFGDGNHVFVNASVMGVNHVYASAGDYQVFLQAYDINGIVLQSYQHYISIFPASACSTQCPTADFVFPGVLCVRNRIIFQNTTFSPVGSLSNTTYSWNFGDPTSGTQNISTLTTPAHTFLAAGHYTVTLTATGPNSCVSTVQKVVTTGTPSMPPGATFTASSQLIFINSTVTFLYTGPLVYPYYSIDFGDGSPLVTTPSFLPTMGITHTYTTYGTHTVVFSFGEAPGPAAGSCVGSLDIPISVREVPPHPCEDCLGSFRPEPGKQYLVSAWTKEENALPAKTSYTFPSLVLSYSVSAGPIPPPVTVTPSGTIIDGWQRMEMTFTVPPTAVGLNIQLNSSSGNCFFDDIRVFPFDGSMKSYVYDPVTLRLVGELDERNYATIYEYDQEGKLTRLKKETERGVMTIKENKNNTKKKP